MPLPFLVERTMKREDLKQVRSLREAGYSYSKIATILGVPKNSVKSYCNRFGIRLITESSVSDADGVLRCRQCGRQIDHERRTAVKQFCSNECRMRWWNAHRYHTTSKAVGVTYCASCKKAFRSYIGQHRKYCCHKCYVIDRFGKGCAHDK